MHISLNDKRKYFHINIEARINYSIDSNLFSIRGNLILLDSDMIRKLSTTINEKRIKEKTAVVPGQIKALGILHELYHFVIEHYAKEENPEVFSKLFKDLITHFGEINTENLLINFVKSYPPPTVFNKQVSPEDFLNLQTGSQSNREIILEEIILLWLQNINPSFNNLKDLFDDSELSKNTIYSEFLSFLDSWFDKQPPFSQENLSLIKSLKLPIIHNPDDIDGQLNFIINRWKSILDKNLILQLLSAKDFIREDQKLFISHGFAGTPPVPDYSAKSTLHNSDSLFANSNQEFLSNSDPSSTYYPEFERFTQDTDWMPNVVMLAKNIYVWLDQLSKKYSKNIRYLSDIPDEELDLISSWHFNAIWIIGLWERSNASKKIKQFCGNPDAAASAYSLYDYEVANDLGGEAAFENLSKRCKARGIRLSSDMVPNHTGILSKWILENPNYYIQRETAPYSNYSFSGPDLSDNPKYQIRLEDRYYSKQDAAVVFQLIDNYSGYTRYIYHGNDGTNMPWNDTAQLNLLIPEVREALIQQIMRVARKTPIIRFDAAMTLTKKHFQRLWYPQPGTGGAIPTRTDYSLSRKEFDDEMPNEFWRDVVDRMNTEMPDTLLLAEAFWLMEGYFVRTLGMHRVYNSAFMHMFMKEENEKYRLLITNTLEFNPEILKRYVNFMSNPDEETAVNQFGKGDKYFGIAIMLITLPGLPMFAHGQIEGYTEKYGMEYKRAYYNETPDEYLIQRHKTEVFPLINFRYLFSQVNNFYFFDFITEDGNVNNNVFAFTNRYNDVRALVIYNNSYDIASGTVLWSTQKVVSFNADGTPNKLMSLKITEALNIKTEHGYFYKYKDFKTNNEFLISGYDMAVNGLSFNLFGYMYLLSVEFNEIYDVDGEYTKIYRFLQGKPVQSIERAKRELLLQPLHNSIIELLNERNLNELLSLAFNCDKDQDENILLSPFIKAKISTVVYELKSYLKISLNEIEINNEIQNDIFVLKGLLNTSETFGDESELFKDVFISYDKNKTREYQILFLIYLIIRRLIIVLKKNSITTKTAISPDSIFEELILQNPVWYALIRLGSDYEMIRNEYELIKLISAGENIFNKNKITVIKDLEKQEDESLSHGIYNQALMKALNKNEIKQFIGLNTYKGKHYFSKELFELLLKWNFSLEIFRISEKIISSEKDVELLLPTIVYEVFSDSDIANTTSEMLENFNKIARLAEKSEYIYDVFIENIKN